MYYTDQSRAFLNCINIYYEHLLHDLKQHSPKKIVKFGHLDDLFYFDLFKFQDLPGSSGIMQVSQEFISWKLRINLIQANEFLN